MVEWMLELVRFTKNGKGLYKDRENHNIYLTKEEMKTLDNVEVVVVKVLKKEGGK